MRNKLKRVKAWQCTYCGDVMLDASDMEGACEELSPNVCPALVELKKRRSKGLRELQRLGQEMEAG